MSANEQPTAQPALPAHGPGSPASWPRRVLALALDWMLANLVAFAVAGGSSVWDAGDGRAWAPLLCWYVMVAVGTAVAGGSIGQLMLGIRVAHLGGRRLGPVVAAVRTLLIALVIPPLVFTKEGRGLHDLASNTAVVNAS